MGIISISNLFGYFTLLLLAVYEVSSTRVYSTSSDFTTVAQTPSFVDKSLMLKELMQDVETVMITAPSGFGKSTNLDMMRTFFSIPVNSLGAMDNDTFYERRSVFQNLSIYKNESAFFDVYFGQYPVLSVNFKTISVIRSEEEAINIIKDKIYDSYTMHKYLCRSKKLMRSEKKYCSQWCDMRGYKKFKVPEMRIGLKRLAELLHSHYDGRKVFVLVDEYDGVITSCVSSIKEKKLNFITGLVVDILSELVKENAHVERAVITGKPDTAGSGFSELTNIRSYTFLGKHPFVDFYGFTQSEVGKLFKMSEFNSENDQLDQARIWYESITCSKDRQMYNPISVLNYLQDREGRGRGAESIIEKSKYQIHDMVSS